MKLVRVPLRISLVGGGSDLPAHYETHGGSVVSFTIDKYIYITAKRNTSLFPNRYRLVYSKVEECNDRADIKHPIIKQLVDEYSIASLDLDVMSDIPAGTGMGSSSAFTVGLHAALGYTGDRYKLAEYACRTEIEDLKEPIGKQDQYAASFGGLNYITFNKKRTTVNPIIISSKEIKQLEESMHLVYLGGSRSASQHLAEQASVDKSDTLNKLASLSDALATSLISGDTLLTGYYIREGWALKKKLSPNVSNDRIDTIIDTAIKGGAQGGKLLGAGGTGFVLLFCVPDKRDRMLAELKPLNLEYTIPFKMDMEGCRVLYED